MKEKQFEAWTMIFSVMQSCLELTPKKPCKEYNKLPFDVQLQLADLYRIMYGGHCDELTQCSLLAERQYRELAYNGNVDLKSNPFLDKQVI